jgi:hypothetical protein
VTAVVELILSLIDLIKAELHATRRGFASLAGALLLLWAGALCLIGALGLALAAIFIALAAVLPLAIASLLTGAVALIVGGVLVWVGILKARR